MRRAILLFSVLLSAFWTGSCNRTALATLDATVTPSGDTSGSQSVRARINFTECSQPASTGNELRFSFSNSEGDTMDFVLTTSDGKYPVNTYLLDTSGNTFTATFTVTVSGVPETVTVTNTTGSTNFVNVLNINLDSNGVLHSIGGEYEATFASGGGVGFGTFQATFSS